MAKMTYAESGRLGGLQTSPSKQRAVRSNGLKGGRPNRRLQAFALDILSILDAAETPANKIRYIRHTILEEVLHYKTSQ